MRYNATALLNNKTSEHGITTGDINQIQTLETEESCDESNVTNNKTKHDEDVEIQ